MHVIVDDREARSGILQHLGKLEKTTVAVQRLPVGDYLVDNRLLFERKTVRDFALSLCDGRLFNQACRLCSSPYSAVYMLEGSTADLNNLNIRRESIQGAVISLTLLYGLPILRSLNGEETARLLSYTSLQMRKTAEGLFRRPGYRPKGHPKRKLYVLSSLPGIGSVRANQLLQRFGTIRAVCNASAEELMQIPGLGETTIKMVQRILN
ncbi:nuclease [candidate division KSB1 bacterium]|nr:nuclease [candidate division KSB1 bacterium]